MDELNDFIEQYYKPLLETYFQVTEKMRGIIFQPGEFDHINGFIFKLLMHSSSALYLAKGTPVSLGDEKLTVFDVSTIRVLARATLETYSTFHHVFIAPQTGDEREFRLAYSTYRGLLTRRHARPQNMAQATI